MAPGLLLWAGGGYESHCDLVWAGTCSRARHSTGLTDEAFRILRAAYNHRDRKLRAVAADLVAKVGGGPVSTHFTA